MDRLRRRLLGGLGSLAPAALVRAQGPPSAPVPPRRPAPAPTPPAPSAAPSARPPEPPDAFADALTEAARRRFEGVLPADQVAAVGREIADGRRSAERLAKARVLANADEPVATFRPARRPEGARR